MSFDQAQPPHFGSLDGPLLPDTKASDPVSLRDCQSPNAYPDEINSFTGGIRRTIMQPTALVVVEGDFPEVKNDCVSARVPQIG